MSSVFLKRALLAALVSVVAACGGGGGGGDTCIGCPAGGGGGGTPVQVKNLSIQLSQPAIKTDNSDSSAVEVTVLDKNNAAVANQTVAFTAARGVIDFASVISDSNGKATVNFRSGNLESVNRTGELTAKVGTVQKTAAIVISGSTLKLTPHASTQLIIGGASESLVFTARNSGDVPVVGQSVRFSVAGGANAVTLDKQSATTNADGVVSVVVTGASIGNGTVIAEWLDSGGAVTASVSETFNVQAPTGALEITNADPMAAFTTQSIVVAVSVPSIISGKTVTQLSYATSVGTWASTSNATVLKTRGGGADQETLNVGPTAGVATVTIRALDATGAVLALVNRPVSITAPPETAFKVTLQATATTIPISSATAQSTSGLTATVRDSADNVVGNAEVVFKIVNDTGTGAAISPAIARTNASGTAGVLGQAQSTFTAGTAPTTQNFRVRVELVSRPAVFAELPITVGGVAGSVTLGLSTVIESVSSSTAYSLPVSVQVTDSSGARLSGARVSMSVWPMAYALGFRAEEKCAAIYVSGGALLGGPFFSNEDVNENLILDTGEDVAGPNALFVTDDDGNILLGSRGPADGKLTPAAATAGAVPTSVTTDSNGLATFNYIYLKSYADWLRVRIRATVEVQGTEKQTEHIFVLPHAAADEEPCVLSPSPFN